VLSLKGEKKREIKTINNLIMDFSLNNNKYSNAYTKSNIKVNYTALYNKFKITFIFFLH